MRKRVVLLLSGGLDSVTLLHDLRHQGIAVFCLLIDYGQPHVKELKFARYHAEKLGVKYKVLTCPIVGGLTGGAPVVPVRNSIFATLAANVAERVGAESVCLGCNADDRAVFPDCRREWLDSMNAMLKIGGSNIDVCAPYIDKTKKEILDIAGRFSLSLGSTWTCYVGGENPCGDCHACNAIK